MGSAPGQGRALVLPAVWVETRVPASPDWRDRE